MVIDMVVMEEVESTLLTYMLFVCFLCYVYIMLQLPKDVVDEGQNPSY